MLLINAYLQFGSKIEIRLPNYDKNSILIITNNFNILDIKVKEYTLNRLNNVQFNQIIHKYIIKNSIHKDFF